MQKNPFCELIDNGAIKYPITFESGSSFINFPSGYSQSNCYIAGGMIEMGINNYQSVLDSVNVARVIFFNNKIQLVPQADAYGKSGYIILRKY